MQHLKQFRCNFRYLQGVWWVMVNISTEDSILTECNKKSYHSISQIEGAIPFFNSKVISFQIFAANKKMLGSFKWWPHRIVLEWNCGRLKIVITTGCLSLKSKGNTFFVENSTHHQFIDFHQTIRWSWSFCIFQKIFWAWSWDYFEVTLPIPACSTVKMSLKRYVLKNRYSYRYARPKIPLRKNIY